jgi:DNA-binding NarL/FixJ family response regulator
MRVTNKEQNLSYQKRHPRKYKKIRNNEARKHYRIFKEKILTNQQLKYRQSHPDHEVIPHKKKFTDEQFLELYNKGLNDRQIAKALNVGKSITHIRRNKLNVPPHFEQPTG